jgi:hypothetical protein
MKMGKTLKLMYVYIDTCNWKSINFEIFNHLNRKKVYSNEQIQEYLNENPMPENEIFDTIDKVIIDLTHSSGMITLQSQTNEKFVNWYENLLELMERV